MMQDTELNVQTGEVTVTQMSPAEESAYNAEMAPMVLKATRRTKIAATREEAITRIAAVEPALDTFAEVQLLAMLWPALDTAQFGAGMEQAKDIYLYAKTKINQAKTATQAQLDAYDPVTDTGWPQ